MILKTPGSKILKIHRLRAHASGDTKSRRNSARAMSQQPILQGHIVGLNGNWAAVVQTVPLWHRIFSFVGPMEMSKDTFLNQLKTYIPADDYIMVETSKE